MDQTEAKRKNALNRLDDVEGLASQTAGRLDDTRDEIRRDLDYLAEQIGVSLPSHAPRPAVISGRQ